MQSLAIRILYVALIDIHTGRNFAPTSRHKRRSGY